MRLNDIADLTVHYVLGRVLRRALGAALAALLAIIAFYYATAAGTLALSAEFGLLYAYLIMAAGYASAAIIAVVVLWATGTKPLNTDKAAGALSPRNMQIAMLIEAVMLGYTLGQKTGNRIR